MQSLKFFKSSKPLNRKDIILFQIKEGMCSRGCKYCYERFKKPAEMPIDIIKKKFKLLNLLHISRAELIGSEPTEYSKWEELVKSATENKIKLIVYTSGLHLKKLQPKIIKGIILHIDFKIEKPFMRGINQLLESGKYIYLRVNFDSPILKEKKIIYDFLKQIEEKFYPQIELKYSFTAKTDDRNMEFVDLKIFNKRKKKFLALCEQLHSNYPNLKMSAERPVFKCCFNTDEYKKYAYAGLETRCDMEYTFYKDGKIALCPPIETLIKKRKAETKEELLKALELIKKDLIKLVKKPSFKECANCEFLKDETCQGGCFVYKLW